MHGVRHWALVLILAAGTAGASTILDTPSPSWSGAFAVFQVRPSYTGPTVQVRRSTDGATLDFYADRAGSLGTSLSGMGTSLTSWLNGATPYVTVWYDQSGSGNNATQADPNSQPIIDTVNKLMDFTAQSGLAFFNLPDGTVPQQTSYTVTAKHGDIINNAGSWLTAGNCWHNAAGFQGGQCNGFRKCGQNNYDNYWYWNDSPCEGDYAPGNTVTFQYDGSSRSTYVNGAFIASHPASGWNGQVGQEYIGKDENGFNGQLYFLHVFKAYLANDRAIVEGGISPTGDCAQRPLRATHPMICLMHPFDCNPRIAKP